MGDEKKVQVAIEATSNLHDVTVSDKASLDQLSIGTKEAGKAAEESGLSHRELRRVLLDIGNVAAPGAGRSLMELAMDPVGAALALVGAYEAVRASIEAVDKQEEELNQKELEKHKANIEKFKAAWDNARQANLDYQRAVANAGEEKDPLAEQLKRIEAVSAAQTEANLRALEQQQKYTIEWMKTHGSTPAQIAAQEEKNTATINDARNAAAGQSIAQIQADIDQRTKNQPALERASSAAEARAAAADTAQKRAEQAKVDATPDAKTVAERDKKIAELERRISAVQQEAREMGGEGTWLGRMDLEDIKKLQAKLAVLTGQQAQEQAGQTAAEKAAEKAAADKKAADDEAAKAKERGTLNAKTITDENEEVKTNTEVESTKEKGQKVQAAIDAGGKAVDLGQHAQDLKSSQAALQAGIDAQNQVIQAVKDVGTSNQTLHAALEQEFAQIRAENLALAQRITILQSQSQRSGFNSLSQ